MANEPIQLGPWPLGLDNVHSPRHQVFQVPGKDQPPARLTTATDIELDDEGWPRTRPQADTTAVASGTWMTPVGSRVFWQANGSLYVLGTPTPLLTGLAARAAIAEYGDRIFISDETSCCAVPGTAQVGC